jgi:hypothetical protein
MLQMLIYCKVRVKVKSSLYFSWAPRHDGVLGEWMYSSTHSFTSALDGVSGQLHDPAASPPGKEPLFPIVSEAV